MRTLTLALFDDPGYTPDASVALYRVDAGFDAVAINQGLVIFDLAGSPDPTRPGRGATSSTSAPPTPTRAQCSRASTPPAW